MNGNTRYDEKTALIVVDMQNDFADPAGSLSVKGGNQIVAVVNKEIVAAKEAGAMLVYTQDWHPAHTLHFAQDGGIWPVHCVRGTWGAELHPELLWMPFYGSVVKKGAHGEDGYSGFSLADPKTGKKTHTELDKILRQSEIEKLVVCGLATDYCVKATAIDGAELGYATRVLKDAIRAVNLKAGDGAAALAEMRAAGVKVV
jgi:nicotinamidase/pyrazinamidase